MAPVTKGNTSEADILEIPLAVDFSYLQSTNDSFFVEDIWDGDSVISENVSKWVASKFKSIAACIGVNFSGHQNEVINLLFRIEKNSVISKPSVHGTPPAIRPQRELRMLELRGLVPLAV